MWLGRQCYAPLLLHHHSASATSDSNAVTTIPRPKSESSGENSERLNVVELVMSAYIHGLITDWNESFDVSTQAFVSEFQQQLNDANFLAFDGMEVGASDTAAQEVAHCMEQGKAWDDRGCLCYNFLKLWYGLKSDAWLVLCVANLSRQHQDRESVGDIRCNELVSYNPLEMSDDGAQTVSVEVAPIIPADAKKQRSTYKLRYESLDHYHTAIERCLFRNRVFHEHSMLHRYVAVLQVDLRNLKDLSYRQKDALFQSSEPKNALDVYAVVRWTCPGSSSGGAVADPRHAMDAYVTANRRAETGGFPLLYYRLVLTVAVLNGLVKPVTSSSRASISPQASTPSSVSHLSSIEYVWNEHALLRTSLPSQVSHVSPTRGGSNGDIVSSLEQAIYCPPSQLQIIIYEKSFFGADQKLGELLLPMTTLTDEWLVYYYVLCFCSYLNFCVVIIVHIVSGYLLHVIIRRIQMLFGFCIFSYS